VISLSTDGFLEPWNQISRQMDPKGNQKITKEIAMVFNPGLMAPNLNPRGIFVLLPVKILAISSPQCQLKLPI
jgi:hypothetical protein